MPLSRTSPKFTPGNVLTNPEQIIAAIKAGRWLWFGDKLKSRAYAAGWIGNFQFSHVMGCIERGWLRYAVRNPDHPYVFVAEFMQSTVPEKSSEWWATCSEIPSAKIREITKDAVCSEAEKRAVEHTGQRNPRVQVTFKSPERAAGPVALLKNKDEEIPW